MIIPAYVAIVSYRSVSDFISQPDQSLMLSGKLGTDHLYRAGRLPFLDL